MTSFYCPGGGAEVYRRQACTRNSERLEVSKTDLCVCLLACGWAWPAPGPRGHPESRGRGNSKGGPLSMLWSSGVSAPGFGVCWGRSFCSWCWCVKVRGSDCQSASTDLAPTVRKQRGVGNEALRGLLGGQAAGTVHLYRLTLE